MKPEITESEESTAIISRKDNIPIDLSPFSRYNDYDKGELIELLEDEDSGNRFLKVLKERNMSLEEFLDQRRRGSSDVHLAMLEENKTNDDDLDIVTAFENFPHFNLVDLKNMRPDDIKKDSQEKGLYVDDGPIELNIDNAMSGNRKLMVFSLLYNIFKNYVFPIKYFQIPNHRLENQTVFSLRGKPLL